MAMALRTNAVDSARPNDRQIFVDTALAERSGVTCEGNAASSYRSGVTTRGPGPAQVHTFLKKIDATPSTRTP